jgi:TolB protein
MQPNTEDNSIRLILLCIVILFAGVIFYAHHVTVSRETMVATPQPTKYKNNIYQISLEFPTDWQPASDTTFDSYSGVSGFFNLSISNAKDSSISALAEKDTSDIAHVYGSVPTTSSLVVDGQSAVLIMPSSDQDPSLRGQSELIVAYPTPITVSGEVYMYLILQADKAHIVDIAHSLTFTS